MQAKDNLSLTINSVIRLGPGKRFRNNLDYCKGCGVCASKCPCGAIKMVPEDIFSAD